MLCCMQELCSLTGDRTCASAVEAQSLKHWTARELLHEPPLTYLMFENIFQ